MDLEKKKEIQQLAKTTLQTVSTFISLLHIYLCLIQAQFVREEIRREFIEMRALAVGSLIYDNILGLILAVASNLVRLLYYNLCGTGRLYRRFHKSQEDKKMDRLIIAHCVFSVLHFPISLSILLKLLKSLNDSKMQLTTDSQYVNVTICQMVYLGTRLLTIPIVLRILVIWTTVIRPLDLTFTKTKV